MQLEFLFTIELLIRKRANDCDIEERNDLFVE